MAQSVMCEMKQGFTNQWDAWYYKAAVTIFLFYDTYCLLVLLILLDISLTDETLLLPRQTVLTVPYAILLTLIYPAY